MMTQSYLSRDDGERLLRFFTRKSKPTGVKLDIYVRGDEHTVGGDPYRDLRFKIRITLHVYKPIYINKARVLNGIENTANGPVFAFIDKKTGKPAFALTLDIWFVDDLEARKALAAVNDEELKESNFVVLKPGKDNAVDVPAQIDVRGLLGEDLDQWRNRRLQIKVLEDERFRDVPFRSRPSWTYIARAIATSVHHLRRNTRPPKTGLDCIVVMSALLSMLMMFRHGTEMQAVFPRAADDLFLSSAGKDGHVRCGEYQNDSTWSFESHTLYS